MRSLRLLACLALLLSVHLTISMAEEEIEYTEESEEGDEAAPAGGPSEKDVVVLTTKNFSDVLEKNKYVLVEFYAPWCGHCKALAPEYAKAATAIKAIDSSIVLGKVDATEEKELGEKFGVKGYPTLKWFVNGVASEYGGGRVEPEIVSWIKKRTGPPAVTVNTVDKLHEIKKSDAVFVLGYFDKFEGEAYEAFQTVAAAAEDPTFIQTSVKDVAEELGLTAPGFVVAKSFDTFETIKSEGNEAFDGEGKLSEKLESFVKAEKHPLYYEFSPETQGKIFGSDIKLHVILVGTKAILEAEAYPALKAVAPAFKGKIMFVVTVTGDESKHSSAIVDYFSLSKGLGEVQVVGFSMEANKKFKYDNETFTLEGLKAFASKLLEGELKPDYKSEDVPREPMDEGVTVVVGKTFEALVKDPTKDVLLEIYAPWCGHCKTLAPIYVKLAKRFKKVDSVVIAKMDGTTNEHPELTFSGFPTLIFFPAGEKAEPITFDGERNLKELTQFVKKSAAISFTLPKKGDKKGEAEDDSKDEL